jgi:hypothetical protein
MSASPGGSEARPAVSVWGEPRCEYCNKLELACQPERPQQASSAPAGPSATRTWISPLSALAAGSESMRGCGIQWARTRYKANSSGCDVDATTRLHRAAAKRCASVRICCSHQPSSRLSRASFSGPNRRRQERHGSQKLTGPGSLHFNPY